MTYAGYTDVDASQITLASIVSLQQHVHKQVCCMFAAVQLSVHSSSCGILLRAALLDKCVHCKHVIFVQQSSCLQIVQHSL